MFAIIERCFDSITFHGPVHGYYTKPSNIVLIVHLENLDARKEFESHHGFKVCTGARYLEYYIRYDDL